MADLRPVYVPGDGDVKGPVSSSDNELPLFSGSTGKIIKGTGTVVTAQGRALLDDNTAAEQRTTLGLGNGATTTMSPIGIQISQAADAAAERTILGLGTAAQVNYTSVGGALMTAADTASARATLGLGTSALVNYTSVGGALMTAPDAASARATLGLGSSALYTVLPNLGAPYTAGNYVMQNGAYGLGTTTGVINPAGNANMNAITWGGFFRMSGGTNVATSMPGDNLLLSIGGSDIGAQMAFHYSAPRAWFRGQLNSAWTTWREPVTTRPTAWYTLYGFAANWNAPFNLGSQRQGNMISLHANIQCTSGLANGQAVCWCSHAPATTINFVAELLGNNGVSQCVSMSIRNDGLLIYNYAVGTGSAPGIPAYPMGINITVNYRTGDPGTSND